MFNTAQVEWDSEKECFDTFAKEIAEFYSVKKQWFSDDSASQENQDVSYGLLFIRYCKDVLKRNGQIGRNLLRYGNCKEISI